MKKTHPEGIFSGYVEDNPQYKKPQTKSENRTFKNGKWVDAEPEPYHHFHKEKIIAVVIILAIIAIIYFATK